MFVVNEYVYNRTQQQDLQASPNAQWKYLTSFCWDNILNRYESFLFVKSMSSTINRKGEEKKSAKRKYEAIVDADSSQKASVGIEQDKGEQKSKSGKLTKSERKRQERERKKFVSICKQVDISIFSLSLFV